LGRTECRLSEFFGSSALSTLKQNETSESYRSSGMVSPVAHRSPHSSVETSPSHSVRKEDQANAWVASVSPSIIFRSLGVEAMY